MLETLIRLKPREVPFRVALRNTVAVVAPLTLGIALDHTAAGLAVATGALNTMFTDQPGAYALRMRRMAIAALAAGLSATLGILIGLHPTGLLFAVFALGMAGGMMVALGPIATRVGLTSMIVFLICAHMGLPKEQALPVAALIGGGGLLQMLMAVMAWPLQRYRPERFALAAVLQQLALTARTRPDLNQPSPTLQAAQDALVTLHGKHRARGIAVDAFRIMAEVCERMRLDLLSLIDVHERLADPQARLSIETLLKTSALVMDALAEAMRDASAPKKAQAVLLELVPQVEAFANAVDPATDMRDAQLLRIAESRAAGLSAQLRALVRNGYWASSRGEMRAARVEARLPPALRPSAPWPTLRANIGFSSVAFRHALRCGVTLVVAVAAERHFALPHGVWIPMTAAIVLKPDFGGTLSFGAMRVLGTFAGLLIASVLAHFVMDGVVMRLLLLAVLCLAFRLLAQVNYALGVAMVTGMLVMLLSFEGMAPAEALQARVVATLIGSGLAMAAYALWPTWEGLRSRAALAKLLEAYRVHLEALFAGRLEVLGDTRTSSRAARTGVQASLERLRSEPRRGGNRAEAELAESLLANTSRLMRAPLSLEAMLREGASLPADDSLKAFAAVTDHALLGLIAVLKGSGDASAVPAMRPYERRMAAAMRVAPVPAEVLPALLDACDRITDSIDTLAHLLRRCDAAEHAAAQMPP